jgi:hypothetical protein
MTQVQTPVLPPIGNAVLFYYATNNDKHSEHNGWKDKVRIKQNKNKPRKRTDGKTVPEHCGPELP